ncbi:MAG: helix-turn-helix domain-containing protein [Draconibacterium sp.]
MENDITKKYRIGVIPDKSIAVLPFVNISSDPENEYFSDGVTEEIINALTKIKGLKVIARTSSFSFKGKNEDVREIGRLLGVATLLEGSVRRVKKRVRITAQLINSSDGTHFWSKNFDREMDDIFELQDEISLLIADQIRENFGHFDIQEHLFDSHTKSVEAYNEYHKGRYFQLKWNVDDFYNAILHYKNAIDTDSDYPLPYYGMIMCYAYLYSWNAISKEEAVSITNKLLSTVKGINSDLPEYHLVVSNSTILFDWNLDLAHEELQKALQIYPDYSDALEALAGLYIVTGWFEEALQIIDKALKVNPLSANHYFMKGNVLYFAAEYQEAIPYFNKALEIQPQMNLAILLKMSCAVLLGDEAEFKKLTVENRHFSFSEYYQQLYSLLKGEKLSELPANDFENEFYPWELYFHIHSGNTDKAIEKLEYGLECKNGLYFCFRHDPFLQPIRNNEYYQVLESKYLRFSFTKTEQEMPERNEAVKMNPGEIEYFLDTLQKAMNEEQIFLDASLSLKTLSEKLKIHPNKLSWLINDYHNKNFNEFINQFRLANFKKIAVDKRNSHLTILGMAYESGFNSKTVFNAYFKKMENTTPGNWLKKAKQ